MSNTSEVSLFQIDDTDVAVLEYQGNWTVNCCSIGAFDNTTTTTQSAGASVTLLFNGALLFSCMMNPDASILGCTCVEFVFAHLFIHSIGTFVSVYGYIPSSGSSLQVLLDGTSQPISSSPPPSPSPTTQSTTTPTPTPTPTPLSSQSLFFSSVLAFENHNLTIVAMADNAVSTKSNDNSGSPNLVLDFFEYSGIAPRDHSQHRCGQGNHPSSQCHEMDQLSSSSHHSLSGGAIAGIIIGVVVLVGLLIALVYYFCRRRRGAVDEGSFLDRINIFKPQKQEKIVYYIEGQSPSPSPTSSSSLLCLYQINSTHSPHLPTLAHNHRPRT